MYSSYPPSWACAIRQSDFATWHVTKTGMATHHGCEALNDKSVDVLQVEVPSIGSPEEDPKTVDLKLRQVQKEKGTMKVGCWLSMPCCTFIMLLNTLPLPSVYLWYSTSFTQQTFLMPKTAKST